MVQQPPQGRGDWKAKFGGGKKAETEQNENQPWNRKVGFFSDMHLAFFIYWDVLIAPA